MNGICTVRQWFDTSEGKWKWKINRKPCIWLATDIRPVRSTLYSCDKKPMLPVH